MLLKAVIIAGDGAAAKVAVVPHVAVPHISQVGHLGPFAQIAVLQLDKGADLGPLAYHTVGADVGIGANLAALPNDALLTLGGVDGCLLYTSR